MSKRLLLLPIKIQHERENEYKVWYWTEMHCLKSTHSMQLNENQKEKERLFIHWGLVAGV